MFTNKTVIKGGGVKYVFLVIEKVELCVGPKILLVQVHFYNGFGLQYPTQLSMFKYHIVLSYHPIEIFTVKIKVYTT